MKRITLASIFFALLVLQSGWVVYTQTQKKPGPLRIEKVKDDLYMISGEGGNVAVYVTSDGVLLVDDMFDRNHADILAQIKSVTDKPLKYVVNTHQHDDHAGGDLKMLPIAEVIAHQNVRANLEHIKQPYYEDTPGTPIGLPRVTFSDEFAVHLGGKEVRARYFGRGHTGGDAVIYFPELKVIHTGDLFLTRPTQPYIDYANGGSALEWTKALDEVLKLDFDTIIPGHGPLSDRAGLLKWQSDFRTMRDRIGGMVRQGRSKDEVSQTLIKDFGWPAGGLAIGQVDAFIAEMK